MPNWPQTLINVLKIRQISRHRCSKYRPISPADKNGVLSKKTLLAMLKSSAAQGVGVSSLSCLPLVIFYYYSSLLAAVVAPKRLLG